jgi:hypothetical protein
MASKTKAGVTFASIVAIAGLVWGMFVFYDRKVEAGVPARVNRLEQDVKQNTSRINTLEISQAGAIAKLDNIIQQMEKQDRKLEKISDAVGARK